MFIFSVPGLTWEASAEAELGPLDDLFARSAIADLAPRSVISRSEPGEAYLTISAGARAASEELIEGNVLLAREGDELTPAGEVFVRRTGVEPDGKFVVTGWPQLVRVNDAQPYDAVLGLLAETLAENRMATAVVANADGNDSSATAYQRQAGLALADTDGVVAAGALDTELLVPDPNRPFGVRLDQEAVVEAFTAEWDAPPTDGGRVVMVEASDLARTLRYRPLVDEARYDELWAEALADTDALFGELMNQVDLERDAVMVIAPYGETSVNSLTVAALYRPGIEPGYLRSASTQRAGIVTLVDVAPTVLDTVGLVRPVEMEGREFEVTPDDASLDERRDHLISVDAASRFRVHLLLPTTIVLVLMLAGVAAFAVVVIAGNWSDRARRAVQFAALANLAGLPMSYVARGFPLETLGVAFYWGFLVVSSLLVAWAATMLTRRTGRALAGLVSVLVLMVVVLVVDVMTGSNLHMSAAFGYSPTGNSRLYGISNYSFGQLAAATSLLAAFIAAAWPTQRGRLAALALMGAALVVLGAPIWGSDVGGVLAFTPTILVFAAMLYRYRLRVRSLIVGAVITVAVVTVFGLVDLARPAGERAHLGRLFERIGNEGLQPLLSIMQRKLLANLRVSTSSYWVVAIPIGIAFYVVLSRLRERPLAKLKVTIPTLTAGLVAAVVAAVLGSLVNDSGAIVGGVTVTGGDRLAGVHGRRPPVDPRRRTSGSRGRRGRPGTGRTAGARRLMVSTRVRWFVGVLLALLLVPGLIGFEAWPLTAWRLFSLARGDSQLRWEIEAVDDAGTVRRVDLDELPMAYHLAEWPLAELDDPDAAGSDRDEVCRALLDGVTSEFPEVVAITIVRNDRRLTERDGEWVVIENPRPFHECTPMTEFGVFAVSRVQRVVDDVLWGPESGRRLVFTHVALSVLIGLRIVLLPWWRLGETPDALFDPVPVLGFLRGMPAAWVIVAVQVVGAGAAAAAALRRRPRLAYAVAWVCYLVLAGLFGSRGKVMHNDLLLLWVSAVFLLAPTDVDPADREPSRANGWPVRVGMTVATLIYFLAGYHKLRRSGLDWAVGDNFRYIMLWGPTYGRAQWESLARWIGENLWAAKLSSASLLAFELTFPIVLFVRWLRPFYVVGAVVLHLLTWLLLGLDYWGWAATVVVMFVDWPAVADRLAARRRRPAQRTPVQAAG